MVRNVLRLVLTVNSVSKPLNRVKKIPICVVVNMGANETRQLASYSNSTRSKLNSSEIDSSSSSTRNVNESSRVEQLVTRLEKLARNSKIFCI